jgi:hypothetical protein
MKTNLIPLFTCNYIVIVFYVNCFIFTVQSYKDFNNHCITIVSDALQIISYSSFYTILFFYATD